MDNTVRSRVDTNINSEVCSGSNPKVPVVEWTVTPSPRIDSNTNRNSVQYREWSHDEWGLAP
jgi:hypothetical protein